VNIIVKMLLTTSLCIVGCAHNEHHTPTLNTFTCPRPAIRSLKEPWSSEDESMLPIFNKGCIKHFTKDHCPVKVLKSKNLSYQVTCKKVK
jgi:hypothetical protein